MAMFSNFRFLLLFFGCASIGRCDAFAGGLFDYFLPTGRSTAMSPSSALPSVPYELAEPDEKFLRDGAKLLGTPLSGLDMCHQRVVLALRQSCAAIDSEQLGKLSVALLNCQSASEARPLFACTDAMSLAQCTHAMDADTWNAYHLITNRAKAVCTSVRNEQFRGLAELTVNRLVEAARDQVGLMADMTDGQRRLHEATAESLTALGDNNARLLDQQEQMLRVSEEHRQSVETSLQDLMYEKNMIKAGQIEVANMIGALKLKLDDGLETVQAHAQQSHVQHAQLLRDLDRLQRNAVQMSERIDQAMQAVLSQSDVAAAQFDQTVGRLNAIRETVFTVSDVLAALRTEWKGHVNWMVERVGGTERFVQKLRLVAVFGAYALAGMLVLVFLGVGGFGRAVFVLGAGLAFAGNYSDACEVGLAELSAAIVAVILVNVVRRNLPAALKSMRNWLKTSEKPSAVARRSPANESMTRSKVNRTLSANDDDADDDDDGYAPTGNGTMHSSSRYGRDDSVMRQHFTPASGGFRQLPPMNGRESMDSVRSMTSSLLQTDRLVTRSRSGTPYSTLSEATRTRCLATTQKGERCRHAALVDSTRCAQHRRMYDGAR